MAFGIVVGLAVFLGTAYRSLLIAKTNILTAESGAAAISRHPNLLTSRAGREQLATTVETMQTAASTAAAEVDGSISLSILGWIPFVGDEISGATQLVDDTKVLADQGALLLDKLRNVTDHSRATEISIPALRELSAQIDASRGSLAALTRQSSGLWGPIATARARFNHDVGYVNGVLTKGGKAVDYALPLLGADGPRSYFLGVENNAEMRDQGAVLSWALLNTHDGSYSVDDPQSVSTLRLGSPAPVALPTGTQEVFGPLQPTQIWQSTNATADFPISGSSMSAMYTKATGGKTVDGVVGIDVIALREMLRLTGPLKVEGIGPDVTAQNIVPLVLNRLYLQYPAGDEQASRRDVLASIASATVQHLKGSSIDVGRLAKTLATAVAGRHLMIWDPNPANEAVIAEFDASGSISHDDASRTFHLAVESAVAAKVDYYIQTSVDYQVRVSADGRAYVATTLTAKNNAPRNAKPSYALGPDRTNSFRPGQYVSRTYLWSPKGSIVAGGISESGLVVNPGSFSLDPGQSTTVRFQTTIPRAVRDGKLVLHFIPQGLLRPQRTTLSVTGDGVSFDGPTERTWSTAKQVTYSVGVAS